MANLVSNHIHNNLPIYLLSLHDMKLVHRNNVQKLIEPDIDRMVEWYLDMQCSRVEKEGKMVTGMTKYAIFFHRWLDGAELTFQDLLKLKSISAVGFSQLIKSDKNKLVLRGPAIMDKAMAISTEENIEHNSREVFKKMEEICEGMSDGDCNTSGLFKLVRFCQAAKQRQCKYAWLDTGCINQQNSVEHQESIRSMFSWYQNSHTIHHAMGRMVHEGLDPAGTFGPESDQVLLKIVVPSNAQME
jgi:hypothetical protein